MALVPTDAPVSCKINGKDIRDFGIELVNIPNIFMPTVSDRVQLVEDRAGIRDLGGYYNNWPFTMEMEVRGSTHDDLRIKLDEFLNWVDITQYYQGEYLVSRHPVGNLYFELCGHKYNYDDGTVSVTNGSKNITGSGTEWLTFLEEGTQFKVDGDTNRYVVEQVSGDTDVRLTSAIVRSTDSGLNYNAERKRHLLCNYAGTASISANSHAHFAHGIYTISLGMESPYPFWIGHPVIRSETSPAAGSFITVKGIGNAAFSGYKIGVTGAATNPKIIAADHSFVCNFNGDLTARNIENEDHDPATSSIDSYKTTRTGLGILCDSTTEHVEYTSLYGNPNQIAGFVRLYPQFAYDGAASTRTILEYRYDANNLVKLWYDHSAYMFKVTWTGNSSSTTIASSAQAFASDTEIEIMFSISTSQFDDSTYYSLLYINGNLEDSNTSSSFTAMDSNPETLTIGSNNAHDEVSNCIIDEVGIWVKAQFADELKALRNRSDWLLNKNGKWEYKGSLDSDDVLILDCYNGHAYLYDDSLSSVITPSEELTGRIPSMRGDLDEEQILYIPNTMAKLDLHYRAHWR